MGDNALFNELCTPGLLRIGWHLALGDSRNDFVADPVGYEDIAANLTASLGFLLRELKQERYRPRYLINVDLPKRGLAVRPGNVLPIEEASLLHAIVHLIAPRLDRHLAASVYSYRLRSDWQKRIKKGQSMFREGDREIPFLRGTTLRKMDPIEPWYLAWPEFDRQRVEAVRKKGYTHLTRTDIVAYFENIDLGVLESILRSMLPREPQIISLLMRILGSWTRVTSTGVHVGRGIPQGTDVSSFLGNIYLLPLDRALARFCRGGRSVWMRYVDDVEVYSKDARTAREVVLAINDALRGLYLNLQGSKTDILEGPELDRELKNSAAVAVDVAWKALESMPRAERASKNKLTPVLSNLKPLVKKYRRRLPRSVHGLDKPADRTLRRLMTIYGSVGRTDLKRAAYAILREPPELRMLDKTLTYLRQLPYKEHDEILEELLLLLESEVPLLPYHKASILDCLKLLHPSRKSLNIAGRVTRIAFRQKGKWYVRQKALELLSVVPFREDTARTRALNALVHHHPFVRRAGLVMLTRASVRHFRADLEEFLQDPDPGLSRLAIHWHRVMQSSSAGLSAVADLSRVERGDRVFFWQLTKFWILRAHPNPTVVAHLRTLVDPYNDSESARVQWHARRLMLQTAWCTSALKQA